MSLWSMNDGSALSGTHTYTNGSAIVQANSSGAYKTEVKIGDVITTAGGEKVRVKNSSGQKFYADYLLIFFQMVA